MSKGVPRPVGNGTTIANEGPNPKRRQWRMQHGVSPVSKGVQGSGFAATQRDHYELWGF